MLTRSLEPFSRKRASSRRVIRRQHVRHLIRLRVQPHHRQRDRARYSREFLLNVRQRHRDVVLGALRPERLRREPSRAVPVLLRRHLSRVRLAPAQQTPARCSLHHESKPIVRLRGLSRVDRRRDDAVVQERVLRQRQSPLRARASRTVAVGEQHQPRPRGLPARRLRFALERGVVQARKAAKGGDDGERAGRRREDEDDGEGDARRATAARAERRRRHRHGRVARARRRHRAPERGSVTRLARETSRARPRRDIFRDV